ncbi:alpha/beta fold hydrolase [Conexibacter sp. SYSU D00693]|uniref:alpha/beta fold hydrolase n=1 Tax=Conexibacter sp. SYSU D00693 TaxID=2812560 RepID=UPI00196A7B3D|nr:alpha/beta hydrolase [Conexibacter sp. SYSU D00693]
MPEITLSQGTLEYEDEGSGPPVVFVHGFLVDETLWAPTAKALGSRARCIRPTLPLGSHRRAMGPGFDASPRGVARLVLELLDALELEDVTLVGNDTGGAICQFVLDEAPERVARVVLTDCDCFDRFPPPPFNLVFALPRVPGLMALTGAALKLAPVRRLGFGVLTTHKVPASQLERWCRPLSQDRAVRDETGRFLSNVDPQELLDVATRLPRYEGRVLLAWAPADRFFRLEDGRRLAALFGDSELVEVHDARTFVPLDQPEVLADLIGRELDRAATRSAAAPRASSPAAG